MSEIRDPKRLLKHLDTFFGERRGIKGDPKEGVNFTLETLEYMTSKNRADQITSMIIERMKNSGNSSPFGIFDVCSGIGGNTMSFLDNPNIQWVVSYEILPERREMLRKNVAMYSLADGGRSFVPDDPFTGVPPNYKGSVLYLDPPWLPSGVSGNKYSKDQYILTGMKIGDKTLEQWIAECTACAMVVMRVPPGYVLNPIPGFKTEEVLIKNSLVIFVTPTSPAQPITGNQKTIDSDELPPGVLPTERNWYDGLRGYLRNLLKIP